MTEFLRFASPADKELCQTIREQNVLVIDDVTTSGSTLGEILKTLRILNEDNSITIFIIFVIFAYTAKSYWRRQWLTLNR